MFYASDVNCSLFHIFIYLDFIMFPFYLFLYFCLFFLCTVLISFAFSIAYLLNVCVFLTFERSMT